MTEYIQVLTSVPEKKVARRITELLIGKRIAACVQIIGPNESTYRWEGEVEIVEEWPVS